jgi:hypothetical protein
MLPAAAKDPDDDVRVLYIAGMGRSGSTLLCRALGTIDGFVGTGELMRVLGRGLLNGDLCSCGVEVRRCELWHEVWRDFQRRHQGFDLVSLERTRQRVTESWEFLRYLFLPNGQSTLGRDLQEYRRFLAAFYRSVRDVTGARVIVDASKNLLFARLLTETPGLRLRLVHLVRDSRGVAHSWGRPQRRPGTSGRQEYFRQVGPTLASILWTTANIVSVRTARRTEGRRLVRYEDFVADPSGTVRAIAESMDDEEIAQPLSHINGESIRLDRDHLIASNPNRSQRGQIALREDVAWRREMPAASRWIVTGLTFPFLRRYGYPVRIARPSVPPDPA